MRKPPKLPRAPRERPLTFSREVDLRRASEEASRRLSRKGGISPKYVDLFNKALERTNEDIRRLPYLQVAQLVPMDSAQRVRARAVARDFSYPALPAGLAADALARAESHLRGRVETAKRFLARQAEDPLMTQALFNSYYSGLRKTLTAELAEMGVPVKGPRFNRYFEKFDPLTLRGFGRAIVAAGKGVGSGNPKKALSALASIPRAYKARAKLKTQSSTLREYVGAGRPGTSELFEHEQVHLGIGREIFRDPDHFDLDRAYKRVLVSLRREK